MTDGDRDEAERVTKCERTGKIFFSHKKKIFFFYKKKIFFLYKKMMSKVDMSKKLKNVATESE